MDINQEYIQRLKENEVPWHRMTTAYGRATNLPEYFAVLRKTESMDSVQSALDEVCGSIEHQSTLWHSTPFAMVILTRIFKQVFETAQVSESARFAAEQLLDFFILIARCFREADSMEHAEQLPCFSDMLKEEYLWSELYDDEEDDSRYEEEEVFPDELFYSFYYYSFQALAGLKPMLETISKSNDELKEMADELQNLLKD